MRKLAILTIFLALIGTIACDGLQGPSAPELASLADSESVPTSLASGAGHHPKTVAYQAEGSFAPASPAVTVCTPAAAGQALPSLNRGPGQHSHLGRAISDIIIESCEVTSGGILGRGHFTHVGANGDEIAGRWSALFTPPTFEFVADGKPYPIVIENGTGRFEGVEGWVEGTGTIDPVTGEGTFSVRGRISSVGSLK